MVIQPICKDHPPVTVSYTHLDVYKRQVSNLSWEAFITNTKLIAHSVATYADSFKGFPKRETHKHEEVDASTVRQPQFKYRADFLII